MRWWSAWGTGVSVEVGEGAVTRSLPDSAAVVDDRRRALLRVEASIAPVWRTLLAAGVATLACLPTLLAEGDTSLSLLAVSLPVITLLAGVLWRQVPPDRAGSAAWPVALLVAAPALALRGWLGLWAVDGVAWTRPVDMVLSAFHAAAEGWRGAVLLLGAGCVVGLLTMRRAPAWALAAGGVAGLVSSMVVRLLADATRSGTLTVPVVWAAEVLTSPWTWAPAAALLVLRQARGESGRLLGIALGAALAALMVPPLAAMTTAAGPRAAHDPALSADLPTASRPAPGVVAPIVDARTAAHAATVAHLKARGLTPTTAGEWKTSAAATHPTRPGKARRYNRELRAAAVITLPADAPRRAVDRVTALARSAGVHRVALPARVPNLPPGPIGTMLSTPTADLLLDRPDDATRWVRVDADGTLSWSSAAEPHDGEPEAPCGMVAHPDVTVSILADVVRTLDGPHPDAICRGVAWAPPTCQPGSTASAACPPALRPLLVL